MRDVFADTGYWIAMLNPLDDLHDKAIELSKKIYPVRTFSSEMVLTELLNDFSKRGAKLRFAAVDLTERLQNSPNVAIIAQTSSQFNAALTLYKKRPDKAWSHTDCVSFVLMQQYGINDALAYDKHFEQAGYKALLRDH